MTRRPGNEPARRTPVAPDVVESAVDGPSLDRSVADGHASPGPAPAPSADAVATQVRTLLRDLACSPRPAGSAAEARARARCAAWLTTHGYSVAEQPFGYSALPGRWGTPLLGVISLLLLAAVTTRGATGRAADGLLLLAGAALVLGLLAGWIARRGILALPLMRCRSINLVATRGDRPPAVWLMAHLDSKSQPVPIVVRAAGVIGTLAIWTVAAVLLLAGVAGLAPVTGIWWALLTAGVISAVPIVASTVGARSEGALDNASGVAAVLGAAALLQPGGGASVGIVITSAEELGLAGARAWASGMAPAIALNCDGVDDEGAIVAMYTGRPPGDVLASLAGAAEPGEAVRARRLVPGILTDHIALTAAGWSAVTVSRGGIGTLRRIHTRSDSMDRLRGDGLMPVARLLARTATSLATTVDSSRSTASPVFSAAARGIS